MENGVTMKSKEAKKFGELRELWKDCSHCNIGADAYRHVFGRGTMPCEVMFIGEAPGRSEDALGKPFVGVAGQLLYKAIAKSIEGKERPPDIFFTNLICCRPTDKNGRNRAPSFQEVSNCSPRLDETIRILNPQIIITLGNVPAQYLLPQALRPFVDRHRHGAKIISLVHPAWILRQGGEGSRAFNNFSQKLMEVFKKWR